MNMNLILFAVIVLQLGYIVYSDIQNRRERKFLQMNLNEFEDFDETPEDSKKDEPDPYMTMEEAGIERVLKAKEK
jgi:hypothetical protein